MLTIEINEMRYIYRQFAINDGERTKREENRDQHVRLHSFDGGVNILTLYSICDAIDCNSIENYITNFHQSMNNAIA